MLAAKITALSFRVICSGITIQASRGVLVLHPPSLRGLVCTLGVESQCSDIHYSSSSIFYSSSVTDTASWPADVVHDVLELALIATPTPLLQRHASPPWPRILCQILPSPNLAASHRRHPLRLSRKAASALPTPTVTDRDVLVAPEALVLVHSVGRQTRALREISSLRVRLAVKEEGVIGYRMRTLLLNPYVFLSCRSSGTGRWRSRRPTSHCTMTQSEPLTFYLGSHAVYWQS